MNRGRPVLTLVARVLLGCAPLAGGVHQLRFLPGTAAYLKDAARLPFASPAFVAVLGLVQVVAAIAVLAGWRTRLSASILAGYYAVVAVVVQFPVAHRAADLAVRDQDSGAGLRSLALAGGFLALSLLGAGAHSVDRR